MSDLKYSEVESRRFGKDIYRGSISDFDIQFFRDFFERHDPDITIVRIPVAEQYKMHELDTLGRQVINADTLVYYQVDLNKTVFTPIKNKDLSFVHADNSHRDVFARLIPVIFSDYKNHYYSNPLLDRAKIAEGYAEWALQSIADPGGLHLLIYEGSNPVAFITTVNKGDYAEIILNGVLPECQGKGIYNDGIRYLKEYYKALGVPYIRISTQIQNFLVQRVWNREGLVLFNAFVTIHLNKRSA